MAGTTPAAQALTVRWPVGDAMLRSHITVFLLALAAATAVFAVLARLRVLTVTRRGNVRWRLSLLVLLFVTLCGYLAFSEDFALETMPERLGGKVHLACIRERIATFPFNNCRDSWWAAGQYLVARTSARLKPASEGGATCGGARSVYRALIDNGFWYLAVHGIKHDSLSRIFVIRDSTMKRSYAREWADGLEEVFWGLDRSTINNFARENASRGELHADDLDSLAVLLPTPAFDSLMAVAARGGSWFDVFYDRYPTARALIELTRPGISASGREALIEINAVQGPLQAQGDIAFLRCEDGQWVVVDSFGTWIS